MSVVYISVSLNQQSQLHCTYCSISESTVADALHFNVQILHFRERTAISCVFFNSALVDDPSELSEFRVDFDLGINVDKPII